MAALHCRLSTLGNRNGLLLSVLYLVVISWLYETVDSWKSTLFMVCELLHVQFFMQDVGVSAVLTNWATDISTPSVFLKTDKGKMICCIVKETWYVVLYWFSWCPAMSSIVLWLESFSDSNEWCGGNPAKNISSNETQLKLCSFSFSKRNDVQQSAVFQHLCLHLYSACELETLKCHESVMYFC